MRLALLLLVVILCSCAGSNPKRSSISEQTLSQGGVIIGGVCRKEAALLHKTRLKLSEMLESSLQQLMKGLSIVNTRAAAIELGIDDYGQMVNQCRYHGAISMTIRERLKKHFAASQYLIYAQIESDSTRKDGVKVSDKGMELRAVREIEVSFYVYDLYGDEKRLWKTSITESDFSKRRVLGIYNTETVMDFFPMPPASELVLKQAFNNFSLSIANN